MSHCPEQKNPVNYKGRNICINKELLELYFITYHVSFEEKDFDGYLANATYFNPKREKIAAQLSDEQLQAVIENEIRDELMKVHSGFLKKLESIPVKIEQICSCE